MPGSAPENIPQAMKMKKIYIKMKKFADPTFLCFDEWKGTTRDVRGNGLHGYY